MGFHESDHLRTVTTSVEEQFLLDAFGVVIPHDTNVLMNQLSQQIARRVLTVIDQTRSAVSFNDLRHILSDRIGDALGRVAIDDPHNRLLAVNDTEHSRRVRAVCDAIRESLPAAVINDVVRYGLPSFIPEKESRTPHIFVAKCKLISSRDGDPKHEVGPCRVEIDTRNIFWRENHEDAALTPPRTLEADLIRVLRSGQTLAALGIRIIARPPVPENFVLENDADVRAILASRASGVNLMERYDPIILHGHASQPAITSIRVDTSKLVRCRNTADVLVAAMSENDLAAFLHVADSPALQCVTIVPYGIAPTPFTCQRIAQHIFRNMGANRAGPLCLAPNSLSQVQHQIAEQHRFFEQLREGSDNTWAAAMATKMLMQHKDLRDTLRGRNAADIQPEIIRAQHDLILMRLLEELEATSVPGGGGNWQIMNDKETDITAELLAAAGRGIGYTVSIGLAPFNETYTVVADPNTGLSDTRALTAWLNTKMNETRVRIGEYRQIESKLRAVVAAINAMNAALGLTVPLGAIGTLTPMGGPPVHTLFTSPLDLHSLAAEARTNCNLTGKDKNTISSSLEKLHKELSEGATKKIVGAEAQYRVISGELMRYHGLSETEARSGANVLRARSLLDTDMVQVADRISGDLHGEDEQVTGSRWERLKRFGEDAMRFDYSRSRDHQIIENIAHSCHVPHNTRHDPLWSQTQRYDDLITAYHALRKLKRQQFYDRNPDVPWDIRLRDAAGVDGAMREISRALVLQHAKGILDTYGSSVGLTDGDKEKILAEPTKPQHERVLLGFLEADHDANIAHKAQHAIEHASRRTQPVRRFLSSTLFGKDWGMVTGASNPVSYRSLIYGNPTFSLNGGWNMIKNLGRNANSRKWGILAGASLGFLALGPAAPLGIAAASIAGGKYWGKPPPAASAPSGGGVAHH